MRVPAVYILASGRNGTLYTGVTSDLPARLQDHEERTDPRSFTSRYNCTRLVWIEFLDDMASAIQREKNIRKYPRRWKLNLVERDNPSWWPLDPETGEPQPPSEYALGPEKGDWDEPGDDG